VRVSAENRNGFSTTSPVDENSNIRIFDVPEQLGQPTVTSKTVTTIGLGWPQTVDPRPGTYYELFWNQGRQGSDFIKLVESLNAIHTVNDLTSGRTYSF
jgi:hypothetical protein